MAHHRNRDTEEELDKCQTELRILKLSMEIHNKLDKNDVATSKASLGSFVTKNRQLKRHSGEKEFSVVVGKMSDEPAAPSDTPDATPKDNTSDENAKEVNGSATAETGGNQAENGENAEDDAGVREKHLSELLDKNVMLEKQKSDLLALIKKQMKYIDVLRKQKIHLETVALIQFSEQELDKIFQLEKNSDVIG